MYVHVDGQGEGVGWRKDDEWRKKLKKTEK